MKDDFLNRLYWACTAGKNFVAAPGENLAELWKPYRAAEEAECRFYDTLESLDLSDDTDERLVELHFDAVNAYGMQGFINGIRLGVQLVGELTGKGLGDGLA